MKSDYEVIDGVLHDIKKNKYARRMKNYIQHGKISTYDHCERVAICSYRISKWLSLKVNERALLRGAMLHDFYLYDWHNRDGGAHKWHGFHHADRAMRNAKRYFNIGKEEQHIIWCHMWPLNITRLPRSKEAWIVCAADKYVSLQETLFERR